MTTTTPSAPSMNSSFEVRPIPAQYLVFINSWGEELREGFVGFLEEALKREKISTVFVDHPDLVISREQTTIFTRIEESKIAITIFSDSYTESKWCLDELLKIKEGMDQGNLQVIPVFFNVNVSDVKGLKGTFGYNFRDLMLPREEFMEKMEKWKQALKSVSEEMGLCSFDFMFLLCLFAVI